MLVHFGPDLESPACGAKPRFRDLEITDDESEVTCKRCLTTLASEQPSSNTRAKSSRNAEVESPPHSGFLSYDQVVAMKPKR